MDLSGQLGRVQKDTHLHVKQFKEESLVDFPCSAIQRKCKAKATLTLVDLLLSSASVRCHRQPIYQVKTVSDTVRSSLIIFSYWWLAVNSAVAAGDCTRAEVQVSAILVRSKKGFPFTH